ncbi:MAG: DUF4215 domain-containing protein [Candidatus Binatia bacterium]
MTTFCNAGRSFLSQLMRPSIIALLLVRGGAAWGINVAVFDDPGYVDSFGSSASESENLQAAVASLGHAVRPFTGTSAAAFRGALAGRQVLLIPDLERGNLAPVLSAAAKTVLADFVADGGGLIIHHCAPGFDATFLNEVFGFAVTTANSPFMSTSVLQPGAAGTAFAGGPAFLPWHNLTGGITSPLPANAQAIYRDLLGVSVALMPFGSGTIVFLGWDWHDGAPVGREDGGWLSVLGAAVPEASPTVCGDGVIESGEQCDDGNTVASDCCSGTCQFEPSTTVCRAAAGACDVAETCTGSSGTCPANAKRSGVCRAAADVCDFAERCDGVSDECPADTLEPDTTVCRPAAGPCDVAEACTGSSAACPADAFEANGTPCTDDGTVCTTDTCTGASITCQHAAGNAGAVCRPPANVCDVAETCTGASTSCPPDGFASPGTVCRIAAGECDVGETCTGSSATCPPDAFKPISAVCRPLAGQCDVPEHCTGASADCPADAKSTAPCRTAAGPCDVAESCDGVSDTCPRNNVALAGTACDSGEDGCTLADRCEAGLCLNTGGGGDADGDGLCSADDDCPDIATLGADGMASACTSAGPTPLHLSRVRLKANTTTRPGHDTGTIRVRGVVDPAAYERDLAATLDAGFLVGIMGGGLDVAETMLFQASSCRTPNAQRLRCVGARGEVAVLRQQRSGSLYNVTITARHRAFSPVLSGAPLRVVLAAGGLARGDEVGNCRVRRGRRSNCRK